MHIRSIYVDNHLDNATYTEVSLDQISLFFDEAHFPGRGNYWEVNHNFVSLIILTEQRKSQKFYDICVTLRIL